MEEINIMRRNQYLKNISRHLNAIVNQANSCYKSNCFAALRKTEGIICGLLNQLNDWNLVPAEFNDQNMNIIGQIDIQQVDISRHIALEIIYDNPYNKLKASLSRFPNHWPDMHLHVLILSNEKLPDSLKSVCNKPWFSYTSNIWTVSRVLSVLKNDFPIDFVNGISDYLDKSERLIARPLKDNIPLLPPIPLHGVSFLPGTRDKEIQAMNSLLMHDAPLFLWGPAGIGKTELAIQLAKELAPKAGTYFLRFRRPLDNKDGVMKETILNANFSDDHFFHSSNRDQAYNERIEILRNNYSGSLLIIDGFDVPGKTFDEIIKDPTYQSFISLQQNNLQLIFTTRSTVAVSENGFEVSHLSEKNLIDILRSSYPDDETTDEHLLELLSIVDFNTMVVTLLAQILFVGDGEVTPWMLMDALSSGNFTRYNFPKIVTDQNNSYRLDTITGHLQQLFDSFSIDESAYIALMCSAFLPNTGMYEPLFLQCLPMESQEKIQYLLDIHLLDYRWDKIYTSSLVRQVFWSLSSQMSESCDTFFDSLWNSVNIRENDNNLIIQIATCMSMASDRQVNRCEKYAIRAAELWRLAGNKKESLHYFIQAASMQRELDTPNKLILASCYFDVANTFLALGKHTPASEYALLALHNLSISLPPLHPDLANAYFDVSSFLISDLKYTEALDHMHTGLSIREKVLPKEHPDLAYSYFQIGEVFFIMKNYLSSLQNYEQALLLLDKSLPQNPNLHNIISLKIDKVRLLINQENHLKELQLKVNTLDTELNYGSDEQAEIYYVIATCYSELGEYQDALENYLKALALFPLDNVNARRKTSNAISQMYSLLGNAQKASECKRYIEEEAYIFVDFDTFLDFEEFLI